MSCYELLSALLSSSLAEGVSEIVFLPSQVGIRMRAFYPPQIPLVDGLLLLLFVFNIHIFHSVLNIIYFQDFLPVSLPFLSHRDLQAGFRGKKKIGQKRKKTINMTLLKQSAICNQKWSNFFFFGSLLHVIFIATSWEGDCFTAKIGQSNSQKSMMPIVWFQPFVLSFSQSTTFLGKEIECRN